MKKIIFLLLLIPLTVMLSGWGSKGHRIISTNLTSRLPGQMSFLKPVWTNYVITHASDADYRKTQDPNESARHYIDIDNYSDFVQTGKIPQPFDSAVAKFGYSFVFDQGILPWAMLTTYDSLKACFQRRDWNRSAYFAADLGHYVGDGCMPLHITANYNGGMTGQTGVHSRYETSLVSRYEAQLVYPVDSVQYIDHPTEFVFQYIYFDYQYVDSVLLADSYAASLTGSTSSSAYYEAFWSKAGGFTKFLMQRGSDALASLIYSAWVEAGSPMLYPNAVNDMTNSTLRLMTVYPNPADNIIYLPVVAGEKHESGTISLFDCSGNLKSQLTVTSGQAGSHPYQMNTSGLESGTYYCNLKSGSYSSTQKIVVVH